MNNLEAINKRYSSLSNCSCNLSCGGALNHASLCPGEVCIDLGSGRGSDVIKAAALVGENGFAYGVDISEGMLQKARENAAGLVNVEFRKSPIEEIPVGDCTIDVLISNCTINHADDKRTLWEEVFRVLKPGGRFVVSDIYSLEEVPEEYRCDPELVAECWAGAVTRGQYLGTLEDAGFSEIEILQESQPYTKGKISAVSFTIRGYKPFT